MAAPCRTRKRSAWPTRRRCTCVVHKLRLLENKVDKHNRFAERLPVVEEKIKVLNHRVEDLEHAEAAQSMRSK